MPGYKRAPRAQPRTSSRNSHRATRADRAPARESRTVLWTHTTRRTGGTAPARHAPPARTVRTSPPRARFHAPCPVTSAHHARNPAPARESRTVLWTHTTRRTGGTAPARHAPPVRTVRTSPPRARFHAPCPVTSAHHARNPAPARESRTVLWTHTTRRTGGTTPARHAPPVRTVHASSPRARFRARCEARGLAPSTEPRTRPRTSHRACGAYPRVRARRRFSAPFSSATSSPTANTSVPKHSTCGGIPAFAAP
ncbi:hypothetical protein EDF51_103387 [Curtobacterium sp. PhB25]|nr:hypothetical protein EDF51_103387 [Curtobacterium sp. PhB25]